MRRFLREIFSADLSVGAGASACENFSCVDGVIAVLRAAVFACFRASFSADLSVGGVSPSDGFLSRRVFLSKILEQSFTPTMPITVESTVAISDGKRKSAGFAEPAVARMPMTVVGRI